MEHVTAYAPIRTEFPVMRPSGSVYDAARTLEAAQGDANALLAGSYAASPDHVARHTSALQTAFGSAADVADAALPGSGEAMRAAARGVGDLPAVHARDSQLPLARAGEATFEPRVTAARDGARTATELLDHSRLAHEQATTFLQQAMDDFEPVARRLQTLGEADDAARARALEELASLRTGPVTPAAGARIDELSATLARLNRTDGAELLARIDHPGSLEALTKLGTGLDMAQRATGKGTHGVRLVNGLSSTFATGSPVTTSAVAKSAEDLLRGSGVALDELSRASAAAAGSHATSLARQATDGLVLTLGRVLR